MTRDPAMKMLCLLVLVFSSALAHSQLPSGTLLPVMLATSIDTGKHRPEDKITARLMQDAPIGPERNIPAGTHVVGHLIQVGPTTVSLVFDELHVGQELISIRTNLRAIASMMEIHDAQLPANAISGDRGTSELDWVTRQVGGDIVYGRRGGKVMNSGAVVGHSILGGGVLAVPIDAAGSECSAAVDSNAPQAMWLFSASACGAYGYPDLKITNARYSEQLGTIVLSAPKRIKTRAGSGLLLEIERK